MHMAQQAAADKPKPSLPPGPKATTGDIVKPLAAAKGAMEAVDAHVDQTGALTISPPFSLDRLCFWRGSCLHACCNAPDLCSPI